ncbi:hypothetical protein CPLU01_13615 [Colletotrichum plurivorum]|uniref:Short-chain dehydrogenase n=1 Tax=Colletotrichum plurivorum TaxID=2175906 RepID=A0A8H6N1Y1_9PEZI|nr:hypothetical protein CPLU01_13615 [Colletotrichum plurivorum]
MVMLRLTAEQYRKLPILGDESTCAGKTYVITGGNSGLGLETARHLVAASAATVVLAVRNLSAGEVAKADIERSTGRKGVVQVRHLDLSTYAAVQVFAKQISRELDRIDGFVCNAGIMMDHWETLEGVESSIFVNVVNTLFLGALMMPKLSESGRRFAIKPTLVFIVSVLGYTVKAEMDKSRNGGVFEGLNDQKRANMNSRYALTKLVEECAVRQFAAQFPVDRTGVVITMVAPGLCNTGLGRDASTLTKIMHEAIRAVMARTAEVGSRTILHGLVVGEDGHGKLLSGCKIKEFWVPEWEGTPPTVIFRFQYTVPTSTKTLWANTMNPAVVFIEHNAAGIGRSDRRALRSHVMRGKNAGRPRPSTRRQTTIVPIKRQLKIPRRVFWNDFCLTTFPQELDPDSTMLMHRWFLDISDTLFPPQFCYKFDILKSIWVNCILVDEAYFHSTLAVSASYVDFFERKPTTSSKTLHHICQAYSLVNLKLSGPNFISDSAIAAVVTLAIYQQIHQQHSIGLVHLRGLHRMIELRGGIARLMKENRPLALKPLSQNVPVTAVLCNSSPVAAQLSACSPGLPRIMLDLIVFAGILNDKAKNARSKLNPLDYTETLTSLLYRLLEGDSFRQPLLASEEGLYGDVVRLAMLAFMTGLLPNYCRGNFGSSLLCSRLADAVRKLHSTHADAGSGDVSLLLWILFMSGISVLEVDDHSWLVPAIAEACDRTGLRDWAALHHHLGEFPWIYALHDAPAQCLWEEARRVKLGDH